MTTTLIALFFQRLSGLRLSLLALALLSLALALLSFALALLSLTLLGRACLELRGVLKIILNFSGTLNEGCLNDGVVGLALFCIFAYNG